MFIVRHGETEWSRDGRHTSVTDLPLTEVGEQQARSLNGRLDPADFGLILTSPRQRARQTAELAGFTGSAAPEVEPDLAEWAYGDYEGLTSEQIGETVPGWTIWTHPVPGGETAAEVAQRLNRVVNRVRGSGVEQAICFAHGHALRALALCWLGLDLTLGGHFPLETATVSVLGAEKDLPTLDQWNARP
nr:histidine phosphatase family protein [Microlunatus panaciterrae]